MSGLLGACMVVVALYCSARLVVPALRVPGHGRDLEAWHLLMVVSMAVMLLASRPHDVWGLGLAIFAIGLGWSLFQVVRRHLRAAHARLAVGCIAMAAMLLPVAPAVAGPATGESMRMHGTGASGGHPMATLPAPLTVVLLGALAVVLAVSLARLARRTDPAAARVDACCEGLMTVAMGYMLLSMG